MAFTAGFLFWSTFFLHFYEISRPRSFTFLFSVLVLLIRPHLPSPYYYPISFDATGRPLSGEIGGSKKKTNASVRGAEDTNQFSRTARLGLYSGQNWIATCVWGEGMLFERGSRSTTCEITDGGKVNVDSGSDEAQSLLLEPWPPLEKALVVEKGMNRESDEREILDPVRVSTQENM